MKESFNFRSPDEGEVEEIQRQAKQRLYARQKYKVLSQLLSGSKDVDITISPEIFEALNKERMEFEEILKLHPEQAKDAVRATIEDRRKHDDGKYWNPKSPAKWGCLGHIPPCLYYSRPPEYWKDKAILRNFFNTFSKFRISTKPI